MSLTYRGAGVDIGRAADALGRVRERIARTKRPEVIGDVGQFGGLFASPGSDMTLVATTDGVGTKLELARLLDRHEVVGAMADSCARCGTALLGGETAEMPGMYAPGTYDLAGFLVGAVARDKVLGPERVREGDTLIGIPSTGLHTNGYSLAREICARVAASQGGTLKDVLTAERSELGGHSLGDALLATHRPYLREFRSLRDAARVGAIAHLTGGGWEGNLPRALPEETAALIDRDAWEIPPLFTLLAELGGVAEQEQFDTWNMGIGLVAVVTPEDGDAALAAVPGSVALGRVVPHGGGRRVLFA